jgi:hypothetical protein
MLVMKNFVILGQLWRRAVEFPNEAQADEYIAQSCQEIAYEQCSAAELQERFAGYKQVYLSHDSENDPICGTIVLQAA